MGCRYSVGIPQSARKRLLLSFVSENSLAFLVRVETDVAAMKPLVPIHHNFHAGSYNPKSRR